MWVLVNGQWVPEQEAKVSVFDRGFLYGDGLFETIRLYHGRPFRWAQHMRRLQCGLELLRLGLPFSLDALRTQAAELVQRNALDEGVLRLSVSRGPGPRGYSAQGAGPATVVLSLHPSAQATAPARPIRLHTSGVRVWTADPLAQIKSANKLRHILARVEAEAAGADAALLLNEQGQVAEADSANVFWIEAGVVCTPPLEAGVLPGITRAVVLELCPRLDLTWREAVAWPQTLWSAEAVFLTSSVQGIVSVGALDGRPLSTSPVVDRLRQAYLTLVRRQTPVGQHHTGSESETGLATELGPGISPAQ
jgi:branched-chain amino acid aminotransferase